MFPFPALTVLLKNCPKTMSPFLEHIIPAVWKTLTETAHKYVREVVHQVRVLANFIRFFELKKHVSLQSDGLEDSAVDSDGEVLGFENLVIAIFDIVHVLLEGPK